MCQTPGFIEGQGSAELRHHGPSSLDDDPDDLSIGSVVLPPDIGEIRDPRNVPDPAAVNAVAADAVAVEQVHDDGFFLFRTSHPVPGTAVQRGDLARRDFLMAKMSMEDRSPGVIASLGAGRRGGEKNDGEHRRGEPAPETTDPRLYKLGLMAPPGRTSRRSFDLERMETLSTIRSNGP